MNKVNEDKFQNNKEKEGQHELKQSITEQNHPAYAKRIILALRQIMQQMDFHSNRLNKLYGLTVPQIICLYDIYERGVMTLSVLAKNVHLSRSTLVGIIDRLEEKELVKRSRDADDRRSNFIDITDKGRGFVQSAPHLLHNRLHEDLKRLPEGERIIIANSLDILVDILSKSPD